MVTAAAVILLPGTEHIVSSRSMAQTSRLLKTFTLIMFWLSDECVYREDFFFKRGN